MGRESSYLWGRDATPIDDVVLYENIRKTRGHSWKRVKFRCTRDCCKYFFSNRVINRWNQLDKLAVGAPSVNAFKESLNRIKETRMGFFMD